MGKKTGLWIDDLKPGQHKEVVKYILHSIINWNKFVIKHTSYFLFLLIKGKKKLLNWPQVSRNHWLPQTRLDHDSKTNKC